MELSAGAGPPWRSSSLALLLHFLRPPSLSSSLRLPLLTISPTAIPPVAPSLSSLFLPSLLDPSTMAAAPQSPSHGPFYLAVDAVVNPKRSSHLWHSEGWTLKVKELSERVFGPSPLPPSDRPAAGDEPAAPLPMVAGVRDTIALARQTGELSSSTRDEGQQQHLQAATESKVAAESEPGTTPSTAATPTEPTNPVVIAINDPAVEVRATPGLPTPGAVTPKPFWVRYLLLLTLVKMFCIRLVVGPPLH